MNQPEPFMTSRVAATQLGVSLRTVQLWVESGVLRAWKTAGGHRRIARSSVQELLQKQQAAIEVPANYQDFNVIVVEDEPVQLEIYKIKFREWAFPINLTIADNGFEGLIAIGRHKPDLIISDLEMPAMDGFQMIKAITENKELIDAEIIVVTGLDDNEIAQRGGLPEGIRVFSKPVDFNELKLMLSENERLATLLNKNQKSSAPS